MDQVVQCEVGNETIPNDVDKRENEEDDDHGVDKIDKPLGINSELRYFFRSRRSRPMIDSVWISRVLLTTEAIPVAVWIRLIHNGKECSEMRNHEKYRRIHVHRADHSDCIGVFVAIDDPARIEMLQYPSTRYNQQRQQFQDPSALME
jgi:hypothetical protein